MTIPAMAFRQCVVFVVTCLLFIRGTFGEGVFQFTCDADQKALTFTYENEVGSPATFVFAVGKDSTCSLTSADPQITGDGSSGTPYTLTVQPVDNLAHAIACGVQESASVYSFAVEVRFAGLLAINDARDRTYEISCDFTTSTTTPSPSTVVARYACDGTKTFHFNYLDTVSAPVDIYAEGKRSTCGMAAGQGTGTGTGSNRYELAIDLSGSTQTPDCGAQEISPDVFSVNFIVQNRAFILRADDLIYRLTCNFSEPFTELSSADGVTIDNQVTNGSASNLAGQARLTVVGEDGTAVTQIRLGQQIKLQVALTTSDAEGVRVTQCEARPTASSTTILALLDSNGCAHGDLMQPFTSQTGGTAYTPAFGAFRFDYTNTLLFVCTVDFCYDTAKTGCVGAHCISGARRRRESAPPKQEKVAAALVILDSAEFDNLAGGKTNATATTQRPEVTCDCSGSVYWVVLGVILLSILVLLLVTCYVLVRCLGVRRKVGQRKV